MARFSGLLTALVALAACASAQNAVIVSPYAGSTVAAGSNITIQVARPNQLSSVQEVAIVLSLASCAGRANETCSPMQLGATLYAGPFDPQSHNTGSPSVVPLSFSTAASSPSSVIPVSVPSLSVSAPASTATGTKALPVPVVATSSSASSAAADASSTGYSTSAQGQSAEPGNPYYDPEPASASQSKRASSGGYSTSAQGQPAVKNGPFDPLNANAKSMPLPAAVNKRAAGETAYSTSAQGQPAVKNGPFDPSNAGAKLMPLPAAASKAAKLAAPQRRAAANASATATVTTAPVAALHSPYENFTVTIPADTPKGAALLTLSRWALLGAGPMNMFETKNVTLTVV